MELPGKIAAYAFLLLGYAALAGGLLLVFGSGLWIAGQLTKFFFR